MIYGIDTISIEDVKTDLMSKQKLDSEMIFGKSDARGRSVERSSKSGSTHKSKSQNKNSSCNYCHAKGHIKRNCPKLKNKD